MKHLVKKRNISETNVKKSKLIDLMVHIVNESITQFEQIDPLKELKLYFQCEINLDGRGLIREWLAVLSHLLLDDKENFFEKTDINDVSSYIPKKHTNVIDNIIEKYYFIKQILSKVRGMFSIINKELLQIFTSNELVLIINDTLFISIENLRMNSKYENYTLTDEVLL